MIAGAKQSIKRNEHTHTNKAKKDAKKKKTNEWREWQKKKHHLQWDQLTSSPARNVLRKDIVMQRQSQKKKHQTKKKNCE